MLWQGHVIGSLIAAVVLTSLGALVRRLPALVAPQWLAASYAGAAISSLLTTFELLSWHSEDKLLARGVSQVILLVLPLLGLGFALAQTGRGQWLRAPIMALACVPAALMVGLMLTNPAHGLVWREPALGWVGVGALQLERGPALFAYDLLASLAYLATFALLIRSFPRATRERTRLQRYTLAGAAVLMGAYGLQQVGLIPSMAVNALPYIFCLASVPILRLISLSTPSPIASHGPAAILADMADGLLVVDMANVLIYTNRAARNILDLEEAKGPRPITQALAHHPDMIELFWGASEGRSEAAIDVGRGDDGRPPSRHIFDLQISPLVSRSGRIDSRVMVLRDISERKQAEEELKQESAYVQLLLEVAVASNEATTVDEAWATCLRRICETTGWPVAHIHPVVGEGTESHLVPGVWYKADEARYEEFQATYSSLPRGDEHDLPARVLRTGRPCWIEDLTVAAESERSRVSCKAGLLSAMAFPVLVGDEIVAVLGFHAGSPVEPESRVLSVLTHIATQMGRASERVRAEQRIRNLAYFDGLTGLPNRQHFRGDLDYALERARRTKQRLALLFLDLDGFKHVNDTLGHSVGDELLRQVSQRFLGAVRATDIVSRGQGEATASLVSRLGGDEFTVLLSEISSPIDAARVAQRLLTALSRPFNPTGHEVFAGASIGIAIYPDDAEDAETLLRHADTAMYSAKSVGPRRFKFYKDSMNADGNRRLELESHLRHAMDRDEFTLHFQPVRCSTTGALSGAEVLLRWNSGELGSIAPDEFIPIAEDTGMIVPIGRWVLKAACEQAAAWVRSGHRPIRIAVNLSVKQITQGGLVETVEQILQETGHEPGQLELEITESTIMRNDEATNATLEALKDMGVGLALDDFGTGYSSLSYLRRFRLDRLKVDRSFIREIAQNRDDAALTAAIIAMAHSLRLEVVAEGVETEAQMDFLRRNHCDEVQGYYISRPVAAESFVRFLEREKAEGDASSS